jgi:hypothetical protein
LKNMGLILKMHRDFGPMKIASKSLLKQSMNHAI